MKTIISLFVSIVLLSQNYSQDTNIVKYLPLKVGNVWVYHFYGSCYASGTGYGSGYDRYIITGTTLINNKIYFQYQHYHFQSDGTWGGVMSSLFSSQEPVRIDSFNCNIYKAAVCGSSNIKVIDSLHSKLYDSTHGCSYYPVTVCFDTTAYLIFNNYLPSKSFGEGGFETGFDQRYVKGIGLTHYDYGAPSCSSIADLVGCVIDGVVYGDTSFIVGIAQIGSEIPESFSLSQNYPNPFNPTTSIKFSVPQKAFVTITIYNVLGEEISKLVNEEFSPGTYETYWDASNNPSGVYYYKLTAKPSDRLEQFNGFTETKKLVVLK